LRLDRCDDPLVHGEGNRRKLPQIRFTHKCLGLEFRAGLWADPGQSAPALRALRSLSRCMTGNQAMQTVRAGLNAIYLSGWQVAADANTAGQVYPDQSLYPANAGPELCRRINRALARADQIEHPEGGVRADRGRCGSRIRRNAQRLRDHEGLHRSRRGGRAFRGPVAAMSAASQRLWNNPPESAMALS
jgi:hypothetical protein